MNFGLSECNGVNSNIVLRKSKPLCEVVCLSEYNIDWLQSLNFFLNQCVISYTCS